MKKILIIQDINEKGKDILANHPDYEFEVLEDINFVGRKLVKKVESHSLVKKIKNEINEIKAKRGLYDFLVVCDESNNTADVIDRNEFVGDIYLKPARSINFIRLNFVAVRTGVAFSEVATA